MLEESHDIDELIGDIIEKADATDAEEIIRALAAKHRFTLGMIDRGWVRNEMDRQLEAMDSSELDSFWVFGVRESVVDMALESIFRQHAGASVREMFSSGDDMFATFTDAVAEAVEPLRGLERNDDYRYSVEVFGNGRSMATVGSWNSFYAAHEWARESRGKEVREICREIPETLQVTPSDPPCYGVDEVDHFKIHARDYSDAITHSFDVEGF